MTYNWKKIAKRWSKQIKGKTKVEISPAQKAQVTKVLKACPNKNFAEYKRLSYLRSLL